MSIDLAAAVRRLRVARTVAFIPRPPRQLLSAQQVYAAGTAAVLIDTTVYILDLAGRLPPAAEQIVDNTITSHCSVCLAELATGLANSDPSHVSWSTERDSYIGMFDSLPTTRILTPDEDVWTEAGLIAGTLARTQRFQPHQRKECLNDALIYLTAAKAGLPVLTANRVDFDLIQQVAGRGHFIWF